MPKSAWKNMIHMIQWLRKFDIFRKSRKFRKSNGPSPVSRDEAMRCRPMKHPRVSEETMDTGEVLVLFPLRPRPWITYVARRLDWAPEKPVIKKLQLDEMGSAVWRLIDGSRTVKRMIRDFARMYQLHPKEAEVSVTLFIRELGRRGIIGLDPDPESEVTSESGSVFGSDSKSGSESGSEC